MDDRGGGIPVLAEPPRTPAGQTATFLTVLSPECFSDPPTPKEEGFFLETSCQDSPRGRALLTRPPVRPWVTAGTGARGFSGLPNENPVLTASSGPPQKVWADLQQKPQLTGSQNGLGRCFKPPEKGKSVSACFPPELPALCYRHDKPTPAAATSHRACSCCTLGTAAEQHGDNPLWGL